MALISLQLRDSSWCAAEMSESGIDVHDT